MVGQVTNFNSVDSTIFNLVEFGKTTKPLPKVNSVVVINVLEKLNNGFKVLIDGRVFFSKLPVNMKAVNIGETLIAKVLSQKPFALSLDNLFNLKIYDQVLSQLLSKLQITDNEISRKILKAYLSEKKPILKTKIEKLLEQIRNENIDLSDEQVGFLITLTSSPEFENNINSSVIKLLNESPSEISEEIFAKIKSVISSGNNTKLISILKDAFILDLDDAEQLNSISIKEKSNQVKKFFEFIDKDKNESVLNEMQFLKEKLVRYNLLKAYKLSQGIHIAFIIIKNGDSYEKLEYQTECYNNFQSQNENYKINLDMNPDNLDEINISGIYNEENLYLKIKSEESSLSKLMKDKKDLTDKIEKQIRIPYRIDFEKWQNENSGSGLKGFSKVNVKL